MTCGQVKMPRDGERRAHGPWRNNGSVSYDRPERRSQSPSSRCRNRKPAREVRATGLHEPEVVIRSHRNSVAKAPWMDVLGPLSLRLLPSSGDTAGWA